MSFLPADATPVKYDFLTQEGKITPLIEALLTLGLNYRSDLLRKSSWKILSAPVLPNRFEAIVGFHSVYVRKEVFDREPFYWLELIAHEEWHRQEMGNSWLKMAGWYVGYGAEFIGKRFKYEASEYEKRAYEKGFGSKDKISDMHSLLYKNDWELYRILIHLELPSNQRRNQIAQLLTQN